MTNFRGFPNLISRIDFPKCRNAEMQTMWVFANGQMSMGFLVFHGELTWTRLRLWMFFSQLNMAMLGKQPQQCRSFPPFFSIFFLWISHQERSRSARGFPDWAVACCIMSDPSFVESLKFFEYVWAQFHVPSAYLTVCHGKIHHAINR
jgi:hypothetical protein